MLLLYGYLTFTTQRSQDDKSNKESQNYNHHRGYFNLVSLSCN